MKRNYTYHIILLSFLIISGNVNAQDSYDSVSFETPVSKIIIDSSEYNSWQIGMPGKSFFNSAHAGSKAILTDTINSYLPNDTAVFIYVIRNPYTQTCFTSMEFWHKYDMDTLSDIGIIEASYNGGNSWILVSDTNGITWDSYFWWDWDYHAISEKYTTHPLTITGKSNGWILSRFNWQWWIPVKSDSIVYPLDSLMIKFTFISDSVETNREGWMIDDILTVSAGWQYCTGIEDQSTEKMVSINPNPFSLQTTLKANFFLNNTVITIYDSFGHQVIQKDKISGQEVIISRNDLPSGLYFLLITEKNNLISSKKLLIVD